MSIGNKFGARSGCEYGIRWMFNGKEIVFKNVLGSRCTPNLTMDKVIINHGDYVAVHDADGSLLQKLPYPPEPISNLKNEFGGYEYKREYMKCYWDKKKNGEWCIAMEIWWRSWRFCIETREFNPDTLEFGEVLTTSAD
ncbi:MAG: hypothetical protein IJ270_05610 [Paludibacteraceae bacterium]|nr:hypothetical protein [Paludibacteraceae bacterium]